MRVKSTSSCLSVNRLTATVYTVYIIACIFVIMNYTPGCLNDVMKRIEKAFATALTSTKCKKMSDIKEAALMKPEVLKKDLAGVIVNLVGVLDFVQNVLPTASTKMEELQSELIADKKCVINLQNELISSKNEQVEAVTSTVKKEIMSFSDVVQKGTKNSVTKEVIHRVVKSAVSEDQRHRNLVIFGLSEKPHENLEHEVRHVIRNCHKGNSSVMSCHRIGVPKTGTDRAVKVSLESREIATSVLVGAKRLREVADLKNVFVSPDRSPEERAKRRQLVDQLKEKINQEPGMYHYIQSGKLQSAPKKQVRPTPTSARSTPSLKSTQHYENWADRFR